MACAVRPAAAWLSPVPELPEVETIGRDLSAEVVGREIEAVVVSGARSVRRHQDGSFASRVEGRRALGVERRGKYLLVDLDDGAVVVAHMGMSGQLLMVEAPGTPLAPHTHVSLRLAGAGELRFVDPRTFGELFVSRRRLTTGARAGPGLPPELAHLGPEPLDASLDWKVLAARLRTRKGGLKALLMNQSFVAGIGNLYSDEILFAARLRWDRRGTDLDAGQVRRLHRSMVGVLTQAIALRGSSLADQQYRDLYGRTGRYQGLHRVYGRAGQDCGRCRSPIERVAWGGRGTYFCPRCQI